MVKRKMHRMYEAEGQALRALRNDKGVYQETVGDAVNVSKSAVSEWERGISAPSRETLGKLDEFFGGQGDVLRIYGFEQSQPSNRELLDALYELKDVAEGIVHVLTAIAVEQGVPLSPPAVERRGRQKEQERRHQDEQRLNQVQLRRQERDGKRPDCRGHRGRVSDVSMTTTRALSCRE